MVAELAASVVDVIAIDDETEPRRGLRELRRESVNIKAPSALFCVARYCSKKS